MKLDLESPGPVDLAAEGGAVEAAAATATGVIDPIRGEPGTHSGQSRARLARSHRLSRSEITLWQGLTTTLPLLCRWLVFSQLSFFLFAAASGRRMASIVLRCARRGPKRSTKSLSEKSPSIKFS